MRYISIFTTIITLIFAYAVWSRYRRNGGWHLIIWSFGLVFYGIGAFSEVVLAFTYHGFVVRLWYLAGAMLTAAWLGQGSLSQLVTNRWTMRLLNVLLIVGSLLAVGLVFTMDMTAGAVSFNNSHPVSSQYTSLIVRSGMLLTLTAVLNIYGTLALVGGALYASFLFWRKKVPKNRVVGALLVAVGALLPAAAGTLIKVGLTDWLYLSEFLGVILLFLGFNQADFSAEQVGEPLTTPVQ